MKCDYRTAVAVLFAAAAVSLQGCDLGGNNGSCDPFDFEGGSVAASKRFHSGSPECSDGKEYAGPKISCNWVGVKCAKGETDEADVTCGLTYAFGEKDGGLDESKWTADSKPAYVDKADVPQPSFTAAPSGATIASEAIKAAKMHPGEKLMKMAKDAADKAKEAAETAKAKASEAADAAKEKASALADAAKEHGKNLKAKAEALAKGDDAKDDAKKEEKRRLGDDAKDDAKPKLKRQETRSFEGVSEGPAVDSALIKQMKCVAPKDEGKDKGDGKDDGKDDAKGDAKAAKLYSLNGQRATSADAGSGWVMPLAGVLAVAGIAFAVLKIARAPSARSRALDARERDEESSQEAIE